MCTSRQRRIQRSVKLAQGNELSSKLCLVRQAEQQHPLGSVWSVPGCERSNLLANLNEISDKPSSKSIALH